VTVSRSPSDRPLAPDGPRAASAQVALRLAGADEGNAATLVSAIRAGDKQAFDALFDAYYATLCEFAAGYVRSDAIAEECVQDVFLRLWTHRATWSIRDTVRTYLFGAVRNQALNVRKHGQVRERWAAAIAGDLTMSGHGESAPSAEAALEGAELEAAMSGAIARMPERRRQMCTLRWRHHLTYAEIASIVGASVKAVEMQLAHALKQLRRDLAAYRQ
jgi:RNA polymerase sigma-70 factor, ECF subfamily